MALQVTAYPFLAVIAPTQTSTSSAVKMACADRIEGLQQVDVLIALTQRHIERNRATLLRLQAEQREREMVRRLREQQEAAYNASLLADQEKVFLFTSSSNSKKMTGKKGQGEAKARGAKKT